jgi:hypothetical protein
VNAPEELPSGFVRGSGHDAPAPRWDQWDQWDERRAWLDAQGLFMVPEWIEATLRGHLARDQVEGLVAVEGLCGDCKNAAEETRMRFRREVSVRCPCGRTVGAAGEMSCPLCQRGEL